MDLRVIGSWGGVEWIHLAQGKDRWLVLMNAVMNLRVLALRSYLVYVGENSKGIRNSGRKDIMVRKK
jgi:hypothetical protein